MKDVYDLPIIPPKNWNGTYDEGEYDSDGNRINTDLEKQVIKLNRQLRAASYRYHYLDDPNISDNLYDGLVKELEALIRKHPELNRKDCMIYKVGCSPDWWKYCDECYNK